MLVWVYGRYFYVCQCSVQLTREFFRKRFCYWRRMGYEFFDKTQNTATNELRFLIKLVKPVTLRCD